MRGRSARGVLGAGVLAGTVLVAAGGVGPAGAVVPGDPTAASSAAAVDVSGGLLRTGDRGGAVVDWQREVNRWLSATGRAPLAPDGVFGPQTRAATVAVQRAAGVPADGIVGPVTRRALADLLAAAGPSGPSGWTTGLAASEPAGDRLGLTDVRFGVHDGFDRVVVDLAGDGTPGWRVEYVDRPVREQGSGREVPLAGDAWLRITVRGLGYPGDTGVPGYGGRERVSTLGARVVEDVAVGTLHEGQQEVFAGVATPAPFRVSTLADPPRLVVDIRSAG